MTKITGGLVSVEDGTKAAEDYTPPRKVRVELRFDIPEDDKNPVNTIDYASALAANQVNKLLGRASVQNIIPDSEAAAAGPPVEAARSRKKADKPATPPAEDTSSSTTSASPDTSQPGEKPSTEPASSAGDEWDTPVEPVVTITDADLNAAATKRNSTLNNPVAIRTLIGEFNPDPTKQFSLSQIPQAQRRLFLDKLEALT